MKNSHKNKVELCLASESLFHIETATIVDKNERYLSAMQLNYVGDHFNTCNRNIAPIMISLMFKLVILIKEKIR